MIVTPVPVTSVSIGPTRALIVGLALIPLTVVIMASIPALLIMPFTSNGLGYVEMLIGRITSWSESIITHSRTRL
jgi:hypothetical protein